MIIEILEKLIQIRARTWAYLGAGMAGLTILLWLNWWIIPSLRFIVIDENIVQLDHGWIVAQVADGRIATKDSWAAITHFAKGWQALKLFWPLSFASMLFGCLLGWFIGRALIPDDHAAAVADARKKLAHDQSILSMKLQGMVAAQKDLSKRKQQATEYVRQAQLENSAIRAEMQRIHDLAMKNQERAATAEGMLLRERGRHKEEMTKAGARISELKKLGKIIKKSKG